MAFKQLSATEAVGLEPARWATFFVSPIGSSPSQKPPTVPIVLRLPNVVLPDALPDGREGGARGTTGCMTSALLCETMVWFARLLAMAVRTIEALPPPSAENVFATGSSPSLAPSSAAKLTLLAGPGHDFRMSDAVA